MNSNENTMPPCRQGCGHNLDPQLELAGCEPGGTDCWQAALLTAASSKFHDQTLMNATAQINQILAGLPADPDGRQPSFIANRLGVMLVWVYHGARPAGAYSVTSAADDATLTSALKLQV